MKQVILVTGASGGFGAMSARAPADAGPIVYASMPDTGGRNAPLVEAVRADAAERGVQLRAIELDVQLARWGIETTIVLPGAFTQGTNHFAHARAPADTARLAEYDNGPARGLGQEVLTNLAACEPPDADPSSVAREIVEVVNAPFGQRPVPRAYRPVRRRLRSGERRG